MYMIKCVPLKKKMSMPSSPFMLLQPGLGRGGERSRWKKV